MSRLPSENVGVPPDTLRPWPRGQRFFGVVPSVGRCRYTPQAGTTRDGGALCLPGRTAGRYVQVLGADVVAVVVFGIDQRRHSPLDTQGGASHGRAHRRREGNVGHAGTRCGVPCVLVLLCCRPKGSRAYNKEARDQHAARSCVNQPRMPTLAQI